MIDNPYKTPSADLIGQPYQAINRFERFSTWYVVGLTLITFTIYYIFWLYRRTKILNQISPHKISDWFMLITMLLFFFSLLVSVGELLHEQSQTYILASDALGLVSGIFEMIWVFKIRNRLVDDVIKTENPRAQIGPALTFFLQIFYLQYKINQQIDKIHTVSS